MAPWLFKVLHNVTITFLHLSKWPRPTPSVSAPEATFPFYFISSTCPHPMNLTDPLSQRPKCVFLELPVLTHWYSWMFCICFRSRRNYRTTRAILFRGTLIQGIGYRCPWIVHKERVKELRDKQDRVANPRTRKPKDMGMFPGQRSHSSCWCIWRRSAGLGMGMGTVCCFRQSGCSVI